MSDQMTPIPFGSLMQWILREKAAHGTVFGVHRAFVPAEGKLLDLFSEHLETPFGPAAGPHTQLAQNLIAAYPQYEVGLSQLKETPASMRSVTVGPAADFYYAIQNDVSDMLEEDLSPEEAAEMLEEDLNGLLSEYLRANP